MPAHTQPRSGTRPRANTAARSRPPDGPDAVDRETKIRQAAYALYEKNGCRPGSALSDWLAAELAIDAGQPADPPARKRRASPSTRS